MGAVDKLIKNLPTGFVEEVEKMTDLEVRARIIESEQSLALITANKKVDDSLSAAKEVVRDLSSAYNDATKMHKSKIAYLLQKLAALAIAPTPLAANPGESAESPDLPAL